jgi:hypothetical protein
MLEPEGYKISEEALRGLKISEAILEEFEDKEVPMSIGLAAITDCFLRSYIAAEVPFPEFLKICTSMIEIIQKEEENRRESKK